MRGAPRPRSSRSSWWGRSRPRPHSGTVGRPAAAIDGPPATWPVILGLAIVGGLLTGVIGGLFRLALQHGEDLRGRLLHWAVDIGFLGWVVAIIVIAGCVAVARLIVRWVPESGGSGVQRVEAQMAAEEPPDRLRVVPAKFFGGLLSIGPGMLLGREGPTVQMGATIGGALGVWRRVRPEDVRVLSVAMAGAGLGVAFNAPIGGAVFALEEVARSFRSRQLLVTLTSVACAVAMERLIVGNRPDLPAGVLHTSPWWLLLPAAILGVLCGALGAAYSRLVLLLIDLNLRVIRLSPVTKAAIVGALVAVVGLISPSIVGGGDSWTMRVINATVPLGTLVAVLAVRYLLAPITYAVGTSGGLFAPLLLLGAALGGIVAAVGNLPLSGSPLPTTSLAVIGMSAFFTAVVRAPLTGIVLVAEMTATTALVLPMFVAGVAATLVCMTLKVRPIYDDLRTRMEAAEGRTGGPG